MRGHDNRIECAVFVPMASIPAVRELVAQVIKTSPAICFVANIPPNLTFQTGNAQTAKVDSLGISFVMTGSRDKTIKLWDALRGMCLWTFVGHHHFSFCFGIRLMTTQRLDTMVGSKVSHSTLAESFSYQRLMTTRCVCGIWRRADA